MIKIKKLQKPIDIDVHFKYECLSCKGIHWLSYKEVSTPKFLVVCDCGESFKIKTVTQLKYKFAKPKQTEKTTKTPIDVAKKAAKLLVSFGFDSAESENLISKTQEQYPGLEYGEFVKKLLEQIRE